MPLEGAVPVTQERMTFRESAAVKLADAAFVAPVTMFSYLDERPSDEQQCKTATVAKYGCIPLVMGLVIVVIACFTVLIRTENYKSRLVGLVAADGGSSASDITLQISDLCWKTSQPSTNVSSAAAEQRLQSCLRGARHAAYNISYLNTDSFPMEDTYGAH